MKLEVRVGTIVVHGKCSSCLSCLTVVHRGDAATHVLGPEEDESPVEAKDGARQVLLTGGRREVSLGTRRGKGAGGATNRRGSCGGGLQQQPSRKVT